jgi:hypothetical protein
VDDEQRTEWRQRIAANYPQYCPNCKLRYDEQSRFDLPEFYLIELTRHSECGHVLMWRSGANVWKRYLADHPVERPPYPFELPRRHQKQKRRPKKEAS